MPPSSQLPDLPLPSPGCDCQRLIFPLVNEELPDHLCPATMRDSVKFWVYDRWRDFAPVADQFSFHKPPLPASTITPPAYEDEDAPFSRWFRFKQGSGWYDWLNEMAAKMAPIEAESKRAELMRDLWAIADAVAKEWPLPWGGRAIMYVIRQWAEGMPSKTLATLLADNPQWQEHVAFYHKAYEQSCAQTPGLTSDEWLRWRDDARPDTFSATAWLLNHNGLPSTPATMRHLLACAVGRQEPWPAYGLLVATRVYVRLDGDDIVIDPMPESTISGDTAFVTTPVLERAQQIVIQHRDFVKREAEHPLTNITAVRRAQAGSFESSCNSDDSQFDYLTVALTDLTDLKAIARSKPQSLDRHINERLARVQSTVSKRRSRKYMPTTPPRGWREQARTEIYKRVL